MTAPAPTDRRTALLVFASLLFLGLLLAPGYVDNVDSRIVLRTAERLLDDGTWDMGTVEGTYMASPEYGARGRGGSFQMKFGAGNAMLAIPFVAAGRAVLGAAGLPRPEAGEAGASLASALWFAATGVLLLGIARRLVGRGAAVGTALIGCCATYLLVYGRSSYLEMPLTAAVLLAFLAALELRDRPQDVRAGLLLGVACAATLWLKMAAGVLLLGLAPLVLFRRAAWGRGIVAASIVGLCGLGLLGALNSARFGDPFATGYASSARFDTPLFEGVVDLLVSRRGGLFVFSPVLLLAIPGLLLLVRRDALLAAGIAISGAAALVLYGTFFSPFGGDAWGPRYPVPNAALLAIPAGLAARGAFAAGPVRAGLCAAVIACSVALQVPPALVSFREVYEIGARAGEARPQEVAARVLLSKARGGETYDLAALRLGAGQHRPTGVSQGFDLWPVRVGRRLPDRSGIAWLAWGVIAVAAAGAGVGLAFAARRAP